MSAAAGSVRLGRILVKAGLITDDQLQEALIAAEDRPLASVLDDLGMASEGKVARAVAESMGLPYIDLGTYDIDPHAATLVSMELARKYNALPVKLDGEDLVVAIADPANIFAIDDIRIVTGRDIRPVVATQNDIASAIDKFSASQTNLDDMVDDLEASMGAGSRVEEDEEAGQDSAVAKLMNNIVTDAIRQGAGDVYIEPQEGEMRVRFRVDGVCREVFTAPRRLHKQLISRLKISCGMDIAERRVPQDGRFGVVLDGAAVDFRVAVLPLVHGELAVMRLLRRDSIMMSLRDLGFLDYNMKQLHAALSLPYGAILVTGPTGSGKSTTLYAAINETNDPKTNLITVEDPVEYRLGGLSQVQVLEKAGLTFASALRSILRQDPDTVMIGEIRDVETGTIAIEAALTGHLVLSTLHTNDAPSALTRLNEMGIEPFLSASAITLVVAQRLARRLCNECKEEYVPEPEALDRVGFPYEPGRIPRLYRARGCKRCGGVGYKGRMGIHEVLTISENIERLAVENAAADAIKAQAISEGMRTLRDDGFEKVRAGMTSIEEILRVVV